MTVRKIICTVALVLGAFSCAPADAALVSFLGSLNSGQAGPVLLTLPRNFVLTLNYTPNLTGAAPAGGTLHFPATPNINTTNTNVQTSVSVAVNGNISVGNNSGFGGTDVFVYNGNVATGLLGPNPVNFSFSFLKPADTISVAQVDPATIAPLISGQTTVNFIGGAFGLNAAGTVRGAPEPSTMIALTGLIVGGCGIGYRRRMKAKSEKTDSVEAC